MSEITVRKNMAQAIEALTTMGYNVVKAPRPRIRIDHAEELFYGVYERILARYGETFEKRDVYSEVIDWLSDNKGQGLLLMGKPGNGKSVIAMSVIPILIYMTTEKVVGCYHVRELKDQWTDIKGKSIIVVDDVGTEEVVNEFGTKHDYFIELMQMAEAQNKLLVITTNCNGEELRLRYDDRTYSRLCGICRPVGFNGADFRQHRQAAQGNKQ